MLELIIFVTLLGLGYGVGSYREKHHFADLAVREKALGHIAVFDTKLPAEHGFQAGGDLVVGNVVVSSDYFKTVMATIKKLFGGRLRTYETLLERGRREAILRMKLMAQEQGADCIYNVRFETAATSQGASNTLSSVEVLVYGSAVRR